MGIVAGILDTIVSVVLIVMGLHSLWIGNGEGAGRAVVAWIMFSILSWIGYLFIQAVDGVFYLMAVVSATVLVIYLW